MEVVTAGAVWDQGSCLLVSRLHVFPADMSVAGPISSACRGSQAGDLEGEGEAE